ncbi:flippase [Limosilactobacillus sp. STM2_1]|uniref:Flippase n=1 Tax=Limosilactobacillus rudii TaxID=2759755 RepID=A0A7W3UJN3_9LACO|nr:flippase [Limosilactobacillus rudii]MBB1080294.1 flippase [Limosilactobacillus rudii]MBB1096802.1 flippase [Limosilactobacillus rudii]MCD7133699.1 flippase [Limosilactobacillus rudii]
MVNRKKNNKHSLGLNALLNGLKNALNLIFPLITFPYVSRVLSVRSIGIYNFSNTYISYFLLIAGLGISTYAIREGAKYRDNVSKLSEFSSQIFTINIISTVFSYCLLIFSLILFSNIRSYANCILVFSLQLIFTTIGTEWLYVIYEDYAYITLRSISFKIISVILIFLFIKDSSDYIAYALITVFSTVGSNILNFIHAKSIVKIRLTRHIDFKYHLKPILIIFASAVSVTIYVSSDNTILGLLKGDYDVGIYSITVKIYTMAEGLLTAMLTVMIPRLAMLYGKKLMDKYYSLLGNVIKLFLMLAVPASFGLMMLAKEIIIILGSAKYLPGVVALRVISFAIIFSTFSWLFSDCILIPSKREKFVLRSTIITALLNIILNFILIPKFSFNATALSTVISEFTSMVLNGLYSKDILIKSSIMNVVKSKLIVILSECIFIILICYVCQSLLYTHIILCIIVSIVLSLIGYIVILLIFNDDDIKLFFDYVKRRF